MLVRGELTNEHEHEQEQAQIDEALAAFGLYAEKPVLDNVDVFYLWPENVPAFSVFRQLRTQWRIGWAGPTGLDYAAVVSHLQTIGMRGRKLREMYSAVLQMEMGALQGFFEISTEKP